MKQTLMIIAAIAGLTAFSQAATVVLPNCSFSTLTGKTQVSDDGLYKFNEGVGANFYPTFNADGTATFGGTGGKVLFVNKVGGSTAATYGLGAVNPIGTTVTMQISNLSYGGTLPSAVFTAHTSGGNNTWGIGVTADGYLSGMWGGAIWNNAANKKVAIPSGSFTLSAVVLSTVTKIYIDGELMATITGLGSSTAGANVISQYNIGNTSAGNVGANMTLEGLYIHNQGLSDTQVRDFYDYLQPVPEPTTATLGLLGLAGLMVRRRK